MSPADIADRAEAFAKRYNPSGVAPFPQQTVLDDHSELDIVYADLGDSKTAGATLFKDGKFIILVNTVQSERHQHFVLGHQLGHFFLHQDMIKSQQGIIDDTPTDNIALSATSQPEAEATVFALSLLIPENLVRFGWGLTESVEALTDVFIVPTVAMSTRLTQLGLVE